MDRDNIRCECCFNGIPMWYFIIMTEKETKTVILCDRCYDFFYDKYSVHNVRTNTIYRFARIDKNKLEEEKVKTIKR